MTWSHKSRSSPQGPWTLSGRNEPAVGSGYSEYHRDGPAKPAAAKIVSIHNCRR
jgi:hypothetical protein